MDRGSVAAYQSENYFRDFYSLCKYSEFLFSVTGK